MIQRFNSKILLFGEYSVLQDSMAYATPYSLFDGALKFSENKGKIDSELLALAEYLQSEKDKGADFLGLDVHAFNFDVKQGLFFESTIPQGHGVGSSGALCASVYSRYKNKEEESTEELKKMFSLMEAHFHGASSGLDPLISFLNRAILIDREKKLHLLEPPIQGEGKAGMFLLNTGRERKTEPLVNLYLEKLKTDEFRHICENELTQATNACVDAFLERNFEMLFEGFSSLSNLQFEHFNPMVPKMFHEIWEEGLKTGDYKLKLCGAGGGGFLLGIAKDLEKAKLALNKNQIRSIFQF